MLELRVFQDCRFSISGTIESIYKVGHPTGHLPSNIYEFSKNQQVGVLIIESRKIPWLKTMQFHYCYVVRLMKEYDLIFISKQFNQVYIPEQQMNIHRNEFETFKCSL